MAGSPISAAWIRPVYGSSSTCQLLERAQKSAPMALQLPQPGRLASCSVVQLLLMAQGQREQPADAVCARLHLWQYMADTQVELWAACVC
jgi:hypothetical protein